MKITAYDAVGYLIATLTASFVAATTLAVKISISYQQELSSTFYWIPVFFVFCVIPISFIGVSLHVLLRKNGKDNLIAALLAGIIAEPAMGFIVIFPQKPELGDLIAVTPAGILAAISFWLVMFFAKKLGTNEIVHS